MSPLDDEIERLTQQRDSIKTHSKVAVGVPDDAYAALVAACASDSTNAFARAGRLLFKANVSLSSVRSDRKVSLLHTAARFGSVKIAAQLLTSDPTMGSFLDDLGRDALMVSVLYGQFQVFSILARIEDCSYAHQSLPFLNNCLHNIARFGLISFSREILNVHRANAPRVHLAMSQYNKDGLSPIHVMAARLDIEMVTQSFTVNPQWLDFCTATGMNIIDVAINSEDALLSPRLCFAFICAIAQLHPPALEQFRLAASNRYKHTGALTRCDGALLASVRPPPPPPLPSYSVSRNHHFYLQNSNSPNTPSQTRCAPSPGRSSCSLQSRMPQPTVKS